jgi:hypothetical protein
LTLIQINEDQESHGCLFSGTHYEPNPSGVRTLSLLDATDSMRNERTFSGTLIQINEDQESHGCLFSGTNYEPSPSSVRTLPLLNALQTVYEQRQKLLRVTY